MSSFDSSCSTGHGSPQTEFSWSQYLEASRSPRTDVVLQLDCRNTMYSMAWPRKLDLENCNPCKCMRTRRRKSNPQPYMTELQATSRVPGQHSHVNPTSWLDSLLTIHIRLWMWVFMRCGVSVDLLNINNHLLFSLRYFDFVLSSALRFTLSSFSSLLLLILHLRYLSLVIFSLAQLGKLAYYHVSPSTIPARSSPRKTIVFGIWLGNRAHISRVRHDTIRAEWSNRTGSLESSPVFPYTIYTRNTTFKYRSPQFTGLSQSSTKR